ncbi:MAG: serine hydrolase [Deltaproteobacteria bacterium]|nr:serine hydrolase [Deltaproteobacteria bacterium]
MDTPTIIAAFLAEGVRDRVFSGACAAWSVRGVTSDAACAGSTAFEGGSPVTDDTLFDLASLTKPFTASVILRLVQAGRLDLDATLASFIPELDQRPQGAATLAELLAHEAGFQAYIPFFEQVAPAERGTAAGKDAVVRLTLEAAPAAPPGRASLYSDLGFIALGRILTSRFGPLDRLVRQEVLTPLGLLRTGYGPLEGQVAATEACPWRGRTLAGEVHDDNAWVMGGVAPHAGLFSTSTDMVRFGAAWLDALESGTWLGRDLAGRAVARRPMGRGLGWDLKGAEGSSAGTRLGTRTFGHLGFTGTSLWVDPDSGVSIALLTNRVHGGRANESIRAFRPAFHDRLMEALSL